MAITHIIVYGSHRPYYRDVAGSGGIQEIPVLLVDARGKSAAEVLAAVRKSGRISVEVPIGWHKAISISEISENVKAQIERGPFTPTGAIPEMEVA
jgi:hypothetical protein